jgi:WD40 repeat protein
MSRVKQNLWVRWVIGVAMFVLQVHLVNGQQSSQQVRVALIAHSGDGNVIAVRYDEPTLASVIDFFDADTSAFIDTADLAPYAPLSIALSPTGNRLVWVDGSAAIGYYDRDSDTNVIISESGMIYVETVEWNPVSDSIGWTMGGSINFVNSNTGVSISYVGSNEGAISAFGWSPDGQQLVTSHVAQDASNPTQRTGAIQLWDLQPFTPLINTPTVTLNNVGGGKVTWSPDGERFAVLSGEAFIVYNLVTGETLDISIPEQYPSTLVWSSDGDWLATGGKVIRFWDTTSWQVVREIPVEGAATELAWATNNQQIYNNGGPNGLYLDDIPVANLSAQTPTPTLTQQGENAE